MKRRHLQLGSAGTQSAAHPAALASGAGQRVLRVPHGPAKACHPAVALRNLMEQFHASRTARTPAAGNSLLLLRQVAKHGGQHRQRLPLEPAQCPS